MNKEETLYKSGPVSDEVAVTVILVTRNQESVIRESILDIMKQTIARSMEVIVLDDGSEQGESFIVADMQRKHDNLILIKEPKSGPAGIRAALSIATGKYIAVLDVTDRIERSALGLMMATLENTPGAALAYGNTVFTSIPHETFEGHTAYNRMVWPDYTAELLGQEANTFQVASVLELLQVAPIAEVAPVSPHLLWRHAALAPVAFPRGFTPMALRDLMAKAVAFPVIHIDDFTGLRFLPKSVIDKFELPADEKSIDFFSIMTLIHAKAPDERIVDALEEYLATASTDARAHNTLGEISYRMGNHEKAVQHYRIATSHDPKNTVYKKNLADLLFVEIGEIYEAIAIYLKLHEEHPEDVEVLLNLGIICQAVGRVEEAKTFFEKALDLQKDNEDVKRHLAELLGADNGAINDYEETTVDSVYKKALAQVLAGDYQTAVSSLEEVITLCPTFAVAYNDLGVIYCQQEDKAKAILHFEKAAALDPANDTFQRNLADFYFTQGHDVDGAIAIYLQLLKKEPSNIETLTNLGLICATLNRPEEAKVFYEKVIELEPWNVEVLKELQKLSA